MRPRARVLTLTLPPIGGGALGAFFATLLFSLGKPPAGDDLSAREDAPARAKRPDDLVSDLTEQFWERLRLFAARRLRDVALAEDVAQEVLRRALEALREGRVEKPEALPAFLFQTARHVCMQKARSFGREARALQRMAPADESSPEPDPLHGLISRERGEEVHAALARMEKDDRDLLGMCYGLALDTDEIARRLGINPGAVRVRKHRALARLAALLGVTKSRHRELK
jgi:RNA polymerase sigma-70 factor (ECF subfamily)